MKKRATVFIVGLMLLGVAFGGSTALAVNNFTITNYDVDMELGRDSDGRSTLRATETITANFERRNENQGLERVFVKTYDGHPTRFRLDSVTDENDNKLPHHWSGDALRIGEKGKYVYGPQTYKITYTQRDVTRHYADTAKDEFYWDVIGVDWRVPIARATVRLSVAPEIQEAVQTDLNCYAGAEGSNENCLVSTSGGEYTMTVMDTGRRKGVTVALGFAAETFSEYQKSVWERLFDVWLKVLIVSTFIGFGVVIWAAVKAHQWKFRDDELGTVVPEYLPPKDASVAVSAAVSPGYHSTLAAQLTDLAVRRYIQIIETKPKRSFFRPAEYDIRIVKNPGELRAEEQEILRDMFGKPLAVGAQMALKSLQNSTSAYTRFSDNDKKLRDLMRGHYGLKQIDESKRGRLGLIAKALLALSIVALNPALLIAGIIMFIMSRSLWVLSDEGLALRRYLKGLEMYIKVAEKDRLKMLQSPDGAEKVGVNDPTDPAQVVKLYEKVLPYAILFRHEKEWVKQLGDYYEKTNNSPGWYSGNTAFNAAMFGSMMSSFTASASSTSSSTGGSSGGGSVGGGGGGGGGGGW